MDELEVLCLNLTWMEIVDSVPDTSPVALRRLIDVHVCIVLNLTIIVLFRENLRVRTDILLEI